MIVVAGEALVDLAPRGDLLLPLPGGSPYNVAIGLGRLDREVHFLGTVSTDGFGRRLTTRLAAEGVHLDLVTTTDAPTTLAVVHLDDQARASYGFYLEATSAIGLRDVDTPVLPAGAALHVSFGAVTAQTVPAGRALVALLDREHGRRTTSLDPNVRPGVIEDLAAYARAMDDLVAGVDLVKVSDEDLALLEPSGDPLDVARRWARAGPAVVVVTLGPDGAVALRADREEVRVPGRDVPVVDTVGAGDAFTSGLLAWLDATHSLEHGALAGLDDDAMRAALDRGVHVAALTCTRAGADPPRTGELGPQ